MTRERTSFFECVGTHAHRSLTSSLSDLCIYKKTNRGSICTMVHNFTRERSLERLKVWKVLLFVDNLIETIHPCGCFRRIKCMPLDA